MDRWMKMTCSSVACHSYPRLQAQDASLRGGDILSTYTHSRQDPSSPAVWAACGGRLLSNTGLKSKIQKQDFKVRNHLIFSCLGTLTNVRGVPSAVSVGWHHPLIPRRMLLEHATSFLPRSTVKRGIPQCFSSLLKRI